MISFVFGSYFFLPACPPECEVKTKLDTTVSNTQINTGTQKTKKQQPHNSTAEAAYF